jgi:hypothetical protein
MILSDLEILQEKKTHLDNYSGFSSAIGRLIFPYHASGNFERGA